jgi:hypothetical protein
VFCVFVCKWFWEIYFIFVGLKVFFFSGSDLVWFGLKWFWEDLVVVSAMTYESMTMIKLSTLCLVILRLKKIYINLFILVILFIIMVSFLFQKNGRVSQP